MKGLSYLIQTTLNLIHKVGFFRITLIPMGLVIIVSACHHAIIGMGITGVVVLIFGMLNQCLLAGKCETAPADKTLKDLPGNKKQSIHTIKQYQK